MVDPADPKNDDGDPQFTSVSDLNFTYQPINPTHPGTVPTTYRVQPGDTLQTIARQVYGDSAYWYRIADANGLTGRDALQPNQQLSLPPLANTTYDRADSMRPYDASVLIGDTTPNMPLPDSGGCGFLQILVIVVAVVVAVFAPQFIAPLINSIGLSGTLANVAIGALTMATSSIVSQGVAMALGVQDSFSWKQVGQAAISGAISGGLSGVDFTNSALNSVSNMAVRAAVSNALSQGISVAVGLQKQFSWAGVAAVGAGGAIGQYVGDQLQQANAFSDWGQFGQSLARGTVRGLAAGLTTAGLRGGRVSVVQVAVDAFGQALGNSLAEYDWNLTPPQGKWYSEEEQNQDFKREEARSRSTLEAKASDSTNLAMAQRYLAMNPTARNDIVNLGEPLVTSDAGQSGYLSQSELIRFEKASYQADDFNNALEPLTSQYDLGSKINFRNYLNAVKTRQASGLSLDPQDIATSKAILFHYYGFPMGEQRGITAQLAGNLDESQSPALTRALTTFSELSEEQQQNRYSFYSNIQAERTVSSEVTRGRSVSVVKDGRAITLNWTADFSTWAKHVGVSTDEALRKTDFDVYDKVISAAFNTEGLQNVSINGAWRPAFVDYKAVYEAMRNDPNSNQAMINEMAVVVARYNARPWSNQHVTSRAVDINNVDGINVNNGGYLDGRARLSEPNIVQGFTDALVAGNNRGVVLQPWRIWFNTAQRSVPNTGATTLQVRHNNHIHYGYR
jgi:hypothetical protein